ncbi:hypothetical protein MRX96_003559 [Rhipicephalus microplus]
MRKEYAVVASCPVPVNYMTPANQRFPLSFKGTDGAALPRISQLKSPEAFLFECPQGRGSASRSSVEPVTLLPRLSSAKAVLHRRAEVQKLRAYRHEASHPLEGSETDFSLPFSLSPSFTASPLRTTRARADVQSSSPAAQPVSPSDPPA